MGIESNNRIENSNETYDNIFLTSEAILRFQQNDIQVCEIKKQGDKESIFSQIESYNMMQEMTLGKVEYCSNEGIDYTVKKGDTLTCICKEYYENPQVAYELMEIYGVSEELQVGQVLFLPDSIGDDRLKQKYKIQRNENPTIKFENTLIPEQQEKLKTLKETLKRINKTLKNLDEINWNLRFWQNSKIDQQRTEIYTNIQESNLGDIKETNPKLFERLQKIIKNQGQGNDIDEELIIFYIATKENTIQEIKQIQPLEETEKDTKFYREIETQVKEIGNKLSEYNFQDESSIENLSNEQKLKLEELTIKYEFYKTIQMDYLSSIYTDGGWVDMRYAKNYAESMERTPFNTPTGYFANIALLLSDINAVRGMGVRGIVLGGELLKHNIRKELYHPNESIDGKEVGNTIVDKLMIKHFDVKVNVIEEGIREK